jgi:tripartite-type tricarboxylate transporter receptor subunit TctC
MAAGLTAALVLGTSVPMAQADATSDFYKKKGLRIIVGSGAGGGYDIYTRTMARHYAQYMPGKPSIIVQNMPGASGIIATNWTQVKAPRDGSVFTATYQALMDENLLGNKRARFKIRELTAIGSISTTHHLCITWHDSDIKSIKDAMVKKVNVPATGRSGNSATVPLLLNQSLGTKFNVIAGYSTSGTRLALERKEVEAICGLGISTLRASSPEWFVNKKIRVILQVGLKRHRDYPDVPNALELVSDKYKQAYEFFGVSQELGRPYVAPPALPKDKVKALRTAFSATMKDSKYLAEMKKLNLSVNPLSGEEMDAVIARMYSYPQSALDIVGSLMGVAKKERVAACEKFAKNPKTCRKKKKKKKKKSS